MIKLIALSRKTVEARAAAMPPAYRDDLAEATDHATDKVIYFVGAKYHTMHEKWNGKKAVVIQPARPAGGPGTELKKLLQRFNVQPVGPCKCNSRAALMDAWGSAQCRKSIETIVGWLAEEAKTRKLLFLAVAAKLLIKRAIRNAEKQGR